MTKEDEYRTLGDCLSYHVANAFEKVRQFPPARTECNEIAYRTHRNFDQARWVGEGLRLRLSFEYRVVNFRWWVLLALLGELR